MSERHIIRDIESSLPVSQTLPARRAERAAESAPLPLGERFRRSLRVSRNTYVPASTVARRAI